MTKKQCSTCKHWGRQALDDKDYRKCRKIRFNLPGKNDYMIETLGETQCMPSHWEPKPRPKRRKK